MAKRGVKPKPTALLASESNSRIGREGEVAPDIDYPNCPAWLSGEAKQVWKRLKDLLEPQGIVAKQDRDFLAAYCGSVADYREACRLEDEHGLVIKDCKGSMKANPATRAKQAAFDRMQRAGIQFGLSPVARVGLCGKTNTESDKESKQEGKDTARYFKIG